MALEILYNTDTADAATITSSTEVGDLVDDNVVDDDVGKVWRSDTDGGAGAEWIKFDMGSAVQMDTLGIFGHNLTSGATVTLQANATDSWGSPTLDETLTLATDADSVVFPKLVDSTFDQTLRYWRLTFVDASNPDSYIELGRVKLGVSYAPPRGFRDGVDISPSDPSEGAPQPGRSTAWREHTEFQRVSLSMPQQTEAQARKMLAMYRKVGKRVPVVLQVDPANYPTEMSFFARIESLSIRHVVSTFYDTSIVFQEVVE